MILVIYYTMINSVNSEIFQIRSVAGGSYLFYFIFVGLKKEQEVLFQLYISYNEEDIVNFMMVF